MRLLVLMVVMLNGHRATESEPAQQSTEAAPTAVTQQVDDAQAPDAAGSGGEKVDESANREIDSAGKERGRNLPPDWREQFARQVDQLPPRIDRITPHPGAWVVDGEGLREVRIGFTEQVTIPAASVAAWKLDLTEPGFTTSYDNGTTTLTITFAEAIRDTRLTLLIDFTITDLAGNELDGEIGNPANPTLPSGNGIRGGQAVLRFNILLGDVNRDGVVDSVDGALLQPSLGLCNDDSGYNVAADLNLDGCVNAQDLAIFSLANGRSLPAMDGQAPIMVHVFQPPLGVLESFDTLTLELSEAVVPIHLSERSCYLIDQDGNLIIPTFYGQAAFGDVVDFFFIPPVEQCGTYTAHLTNSLPDVTGELLVPPATPPILTGLVPPPAPTLNAHTTMTTASQVTITGFSPGATWVEVVHPAGSFLATVTNNAFSANVPLSPNQINPIFFTGLSTCAGVRGPQRVTRIIQDTVPPNLYIDFPADGSQITTNATDVAGRVGDVLSGFAGLTVTVNGIPAVVDEGVGNNGTFFAPSVPLNVGQANVLQVVATDALGNNRTKQITVTQAAIPANSPRMTIVSGNGQMATAMTVLPQPIVVKMANPDGVTPFVNKVVTFDVTRSNGRLGPSIAALLPTPQDHDPGSMKYQVRTDANGEARAYWRLGSDAGNGNNRVNATSLSIAGTVTFCASSTPMPVRQINIGTGNNQKCEAGAPALEPLRAWVSDGCNGREGEQVRFTVLRGGGKVNNLNSVTVTTDRTGHALVNFTLGPEEGTNEIEASLPAYTSILPARFNIYGLKRDPGQPTSFFGVVLNNAGQPIENVSTMLVVGSVATPVVHTDINGQFRFDNVTGSGDADLYVNGAMATHVGGPTCTAQSCTVAPNTFPTLHFELVVVPNAANSMTMPVMLPPLNPNNVVSTYSATPGNPDTVLMVEGMDGLKMFVKAGSMTLASGQLAPNGTPIYLNQVHDEDIPMPIPDGASPPFAWTLQPAGAKFDPPIEIHYPNMSGLPAGAIAYFLSFNHDTSRFEIIASGHVIADGSTIVTDPGVGLGLAGWGCNCPPYAVTGDCCTGCDDCCDGGCCCGDACCAGPCCAGGCCAAGGSCCNGSCCDGPCCNGQCCPAGGSCCNGTCCDGPCCEETGQCCPAGDKSCCNNQCCAGPCCEGLCCPAGGSCCNGQCCAGPCCEATGECCPTGGSCCDNECCAGPCCEATGECCPAGGSCCNNECCSGPCCQGNCCDSGESCCGEDCCESGKTCCNPSTGFCCPMGRQCCENQTTCCPYNQVCCNEGCCPPGRICCGNECCKPAKCCNNECCGPNEICCNGFCQTTDCSLSLDPDMVCPGGTVELQGVAICNPDCATMSLTAEIVEPAWQGLASVSVSPGSVACGPFKTPFTVTVTVSADAAPGVFTVRVKGKIINAGEVACETTAQATVTVDECVNLHFDAVSDDQETNPGGFLCVNDDDDNDNNMPDKDETTPTMGENDLVPLIIALSGGWTGQGTVTLSCESGCNRIRLYEEMNRSSTNNASMLGAVNLPVCWSTTQPGCRPWSDLPETLYAEGLTPSMALRDVELKALFTGEGGPCEDHVKLTIVGVASMTPDVASKVLISMLHGGAYPSPQQTTDRKIRVKATLQLPLVGQRVYFRTFDPDDKSPYEADSLTDDNRHATFRRGSLEVPAGYTEVAASRQLDTNGNVIELGVLSTTGGIAEADLQITDRYSGDNYLVAAHCGPKPALTNRQTANMVAWKRVYLERDSMYTKGGTITSSFTPDANTADDVLTLDSTTDLAVGNMITIFSPTASIDTIINAKTASTITVPDLPSAFARFSGVRLTADTTTYTVTTSLFSAAYGADPEGTDGGTMVEYLDAPSGLGGIPKYTSFPADGDVTSMAFCNFWFENSSSSSNTFQLVAAYKHDDGSFGTTNGPMNISFITTGNFSFGATNQAAIDETAVHEIAHQFSVANGHVDMDVVAPNYLMTDDCVMSYHRVRDNSIVEFESDCFYDIRDQTDAP